MSHAFRRPLTVQLNDRTPTTPAIDSDRRSPRSVVMSEILSVNQSATTEFLDRFDDLQLQRYLDHLRWGRESRRQPWARPGETPAIISERVRI